MIFFSLRAYSQIYIQDSSVICVKNGALHGSIIEKKSKAKIYVADETIIHNIEEFSSSEIIYPEKKITKVSTVLAHKSIKQKIRPNIAPTKKKIQEQNNSLAKVDQSKKSSHYVLAAYQNSLILPVQQNTYPSICHKDEIFKVIVLKADKLENIIYKDLLFYNGTINSYRVRPPPSCSIQS